SSAKSLALGRGRLLRPSVDRTIMIDRIRNYGWLAIEAAFLIVLFCLLMNIILGDDGGGEYVAMVAGNAIHTMQEIPPGIVVGVVLILVLYRFLEYRRPKYRIAGIFESRFPRYRAPRRLSPSGRTRIGGLPSRSKNFRWRRLWPQRMAAFAPSRAGAPSFRLAPGRSAPTACRYRRGRRCAGGRSTRICRNRRGTR